jgi:hypothetical protein
MTQDTSRILGGLWAALYQLHKEEQPRITIETERGQFIIRLHYSRNGTTHQKLGARGATLDAAILEAGQEMRKALAATVTELQATNERKIGELNGALAVLS